MSIVVILYDPNLMYWEVHAFLHNYAALRLLAPPHSISL